MAAGLEKAAPEAIPKASLRRTNVWAWLIVPALVFLALFFVYPLYEILTRSFTEPAVGIQNYVEFFGTEVYVGVLVNTLRISLLTTTICLLLAYPYAYIMAHVSRRMAGVLLIAVLIPFWSSILVRTFAWSVILQDTGLINSVLLGLGIVDEPVALIRNLIGVVVGMVHILIPFMVLPIYAVMRGIDTNLVRAAANLGSSPLDAFRRVYLPLSLPGVFAGSLLVFVLSLGSYVTPAILGNPEQAMLGQVIVTQIQSLLDWGMGAAIALVLLVVTLVTLAIAGRIVNVGEAFGGRPGD